MAKVGMTLAAATLAVACLDGVSQAQVAELYNGSFETKALCAGSQLGGWRRYNNALWYSGDRATNPSSQPLPLGILPRTGQGMVSLSTATEFSGVETEDRLYLNVPTLACIDPDTYPPENFPYNWPAYVYQPQLDGDPTNNNTCDVAGGGTIPHDPDPVNITAGQPITVKGWYLIPTATPIVGTKCGLKVTFQSDFINNPGQFGNWFIKEVLSIDGNVPGGVHTNDQWTEYSMTISQSEFSDPRPCWTPPIGGTGYVKITAVQFDSDLNGASGIIYWDDISISQGETPCQQADFDNNGSVSVNDLFAFLSAWFAQNGGAPGSPSADIDGNNTVSVNDLFAFLSLWFQYNGQAC